MTRDERRTAHLVFAPEISSGELASSDLDGPELARAVEVKPVPSALSRRIQSRALRRGRLGGLAAFEPAASARRTLLGAAAAGPPRVFLRVDGFGHPAFADVHALLGEAGVPHLVVVSPDEAHRGALVALRHDGVAFAQLAGDAEADVAGMRARALGRMLDAGRETLERMAIDARVVAAPGDRFGERAWPQLAARFDVVSAGPRTVEGMGFHATVHWRGDAVYLPAHRPLHGPAGVVAAALESLTDQGVALPMAATIAVADESADRSRGLARLAALLGAGIGRDWNELEAAIALSRRAA